MKAVVVPVSVEARVPEVKMGRVEITVDRGGTCRGAGRIMRTMTIDADQLLQLCAMQDPSLVAGCTCGPLQMSAWESITEERWPAGVLRVGTLRAPGDEEPTFEEFHPNGTRYGSPDAPIAPQWFPYNRSDAYVCGRCHSVFLRYTEYGGYYVDHRVRMVDPALIVEV